MDNHQDLALQLAGLYSQFTQVQSVAISGSLTSGVVTDLASDIDLYIYTTAPIPLEDRIALVEAVGGASRADMNLDFWDPGDEWFHAATGIEADVMYWDTAWVEDMLDRVVNRCQVSLGYTTAHWNTIQKSRALFDRNGWFARLQADYAVAYPEPLRRAIIARNHAILRGVIPAYFHQIEKAARRGDPVSVNHRVAALLASYFDIVFAVNRVLHPGEKRLIDQAQRLCIRLPGGMASQIEQVLRSAGMPGGSVIADVECLLDQMDTWLKNEESWLFDGAG